MKKLSCTYILLFLFMVHGRCQLPVHSKSISFYQLNSTHGLSGNYINALCTDNNGSLWVGTAEGLNRFNGKTVTRFFSNEYPQLANNNILALAADNANRVWVLCEGGALTLIDNDRHFHKCVLEQPGKKLRVKRLLYTALREIILQTETGFYTVINMDNTDVADSLTMKNFVPLPVSGFNPAIANSATQAEQYDAGRYLFTGNGFFYIVNFKEGRVETTIPAKEQAFLLQWQPGELLVYNRAEEKLQSINRLTGNITYPFARITDQFSQPVAPRILSAKMIEKDMLLLTTLRDGLYIFHTVNKTLTRYTHRAGDPTTIVNDRPAVTCLASNGWVFIGSKLNGISYFKTGAVVGHQSFFADRNGNSYDSYINSIVTADNEQYFIGTGNNLLKWNRRTNSTQFVNYAVINGKPVVNDEGTSLLCFDARGRLWFITSTKGIVVMDKNERMLKRIPVDTTSANGLMATWAEQMILGPDGWMWLATRKGIRRINPENFRVDDMRQTALGGLYNTECNHLLFNNNGDIWVASEQNGLYQYRPGTNTLRRYAINSGGISNKYNCITADAQGIVYAGSNNGVQIFSADGTTTTITEQDGLINNRVNILMMDSKNRLWVGNVSDIACYDTQNRSLKYFDEAYGLNNQRLRKWAFFQSAPGELFWGTEKGIQFFYPDELMNYTIGMKAIVSRMETGRLKTDLTRSKTFRLHAGDNNISFQFQTSEFLSQVRTFFQYKLEGADKQWQLLYNQNTVQYNSLPPGKYVFKLKAGYDNQHWVNSENEITVYVLPPFYKTWWFRALLAALVAGILIAYLRWRERSIKGKEKANTELHKLKAETYKRQLETEQVTGFFTSTIHQHNNTEDMLWDVARNLIGKLGFEDCMIYLWNEDKTVLVQKAGYGIKGSMQAEMDVVDYHVPRGKGIVGAAVESKQYLLVNDTSTDPRYFSADDKVRYSELCVPMLRGSEVIGAINTEHSEKGFYTEHHVQVLGTIAFLLAEKMEKIEAQQRSREKETEVLKLNNDLATSQLTALRSQMNPHFIFNALNSVQQFILQGNITEANRYLSKFSKLQRLVLNHSSQNFIPLEKELEVLNLYLELEQLRFEQGFSYSIKNGDAIDADEIRIPPMIIQPFVENAIWHGLMTKHGDRRLSINFEMNGEETLVCTITDNGIGRAAAARLKGSLPHPYTSKGLTLVYDRLDILSQQYGQVYRAEINDLADEHGMALGTEVKLHIYTG